MFYAGLQSLVMMAKLNLHLLRVASGIEIISGFVIYLPKLLSHSVLFIRKALHICTSYRAAWRTKAMCISLSCWRLWKGSRKHRGRSWKSKVTMAGIAHKCISGESSMFLYGVSLPLVSHNQCRYSTQEQRAANGQATLFPTNGITNITQCYPICACNPVID